MKPESQGITHQRVLNIAIPVVLANITLTNLGAVDTAVVGQMGAAAPIGAVGIGAIILGALYWMFGFLRMGTVGLASQAIGAHQRGEVAALLTRVLCIGGAVAWCWWDCSNHCSGRHFESLQHRLRSKVWPANI